MSKVAAPRPRYIAFRIDAGKAPSRRALQDLLRSAAKQSGWSGEPPQLTRFAAPHGIVRVSHEAQAATRALLESAGATTLGASGTLKALTERLGILAERDAPGSAGPASPTSPASARPRQP